jgi:hypothetical protein
MSRFRYPQVLSTAQPGIVAVAARLLGFIVLALSFVVGVGEVQVALLSSTGANLTKQVGFGSALNWSLCLTVVLPMAASQARDELRTDLRLRPAVGTEVFGLDPDVIEKRLDGMVFWPVRYIRARELLGLIVLGVTCIFFYKIGMILIGLLMFRLFWEVFHYLVGAIGKSETVKAP